MHYARPTVAWCMAAFYLLLVSGIPLPIRIASGGKDRSQPFPCRDSLCGCQSAADCWESCCCHTLAERVAWARAHGVTPPESALVALASQSESPASEAAHACGGGCAACELPAEQGDCCSRKHHKPTHDESDQSAPSDRGLVVLIQAMGCQGVDFNPLSATPAIPLVVLDATLTLPATGWLHICDPPVEVPPAALPAVPPPQDAIA